MLAHGEDDQVKLNHAIAQAGEATGLEVVDQRAQSHPSHTSLEVPSKTSPMYVATADCSEVPTDRDTFRSLSCQPRSGRFSPRLGYGIWLDPDRFIRITEPPLDILPYIGPGKYTVAGRISWACLDYGYACLQEAMMTRAANRTNKDDWLTSLPLGSAARRAFDRSLRHSKPLQDVAYIMDLVEARMEFQKEGYMRGNTRGSDEISRQVLQGSVANDLRTRGVRLDPWWSALDIQAYLQTRMGIPNFSALQIALCSQQAEQIELFMPLAQSLGHNAVCFGDGPRWNVPLTEAFISAWLDQVSRLAM